MKVIDHFGPKVANSKLSESDTEQLFNICQESNDRYNHKLVGLINEEMDITNLLRNSPLHRIILDKVITYLTEVDAGLWDKVVDTNPEFDLLEMQSAWYNKQVHMEYNPPHDHRHSADLVCVIFPKIYIDESADYYINYKQVKQEGQLTFIYGEHTKNDFGKKQITIQPEEGDMFIFPATLGHYTAPVLGNSVRYSVSCNFTFSNLAQRLLRKINSNEN
jgi:hypothetical protein